MNATRTPFQSPLGRLAATCAVLALLLPARAVAQEPPSTSGPSADVPATDAPQPSEDPGQRPPAIAGARKVTLNINNWTLKDLVKYFAELTGRNFLINEQSDLKETVTIISHKPVTVNEAYEAFLQALEMHGYTTMTAAGLTRIVKSDTAAQVPIVLGEGVEVSGGAQFVTQIIPLENVSVSDVQSVVQSLLSPQAKVVAYAPSNTFIITENAQNLRRVLKILTQLDVAAPKSTLAIIAVQYADAGEIKAIIEELYGTAETEAGASRAVPDRASRRRPRRDEPPEAPTEGGAEGVTAGAESKYISKVIADERTNSLIVLANEQGMAAIQELLGKLDVDAETHGEQIYVHALEHAKAEEVANVLANLSQGGSSQQQQRRPTSQTQTGREGTTGRTSTRPGAETATGRDSKAAEGEGGTGSVTAVFDSGMRITHDESTNSLVIIARPDDYRVLRQVIDKLDVRRRQVLIDAVILELGGSDQNQFEVAFHGPFQPSDEIGGIFGGQFGANSIGLTQDMLSGVAMGVFGPTVSVPFQIGGELIDVDVPAFGIVVHALRADSSVEIVSNPQLLTLDNEEAKIVVGRKVPFPTNTTFSQFGQPITSFQREDVATTLQVTPRVNSEDYVTLEVLVEVSDIEQAAPTGFDTTQSGLITSKREVETVALVGDNETVVLGGLVGTTETRSEKKVPILGDLPLIGVLFRSNSVELRKTNLMIFLTPHIVDDEQDMVEIMRVKEAQRQEFIRRFYGKSREQQMEELEDLLQYSMNFSGRDSVYPERQPQLDEGDMSDEARDVLRDALEDRPTTPGEGAGTLPEDTQPQPEAP